MTTTVSVPGGAGTFQATASGVASVTGTGTNSVQIAGTLTDVNATLASLTYTPAVNAAGAQTITVTTSDGSASTGGPNTDSDTIAVTVVDRPTLANLDGDTVGYSQQGGPVALDRRHRGGAERQRQRQLQRRQPGRHLPGRPAGGRPAGDRHQRHGDPVRRPDRGQHRLGRRHGRGDDPGGRDRR
ncbi:MAG: hypothetical protein U5O15_11070 [Candidatus Krumholzibacteriota bacterium]|nr:hypothetical protein [Candidatus Krumholzibacteriota bacterium]